MYRRPIDGTYEMCLRINKRDPSIYCKFMPVEPGTNNKLVHFKEDYPEYIPDISKCIFEYHMDEDYAIDTVTGTTYRLIYHGR